VGWYLEGFGQHFAHLLFGEGAGTFHQFAITFALFLSLSPAARTRANCTSEDLGPPPSVDGAFAVVKTDDGVGVSECPGMG
jgi:hypothetical protein